MIVLGTLGAREQRRLRRGRPSPVREAREPEPVPTARATLVRATPFGSQEEAVAWLARLRKDRDALDAEVEGALLELNAVLRAHRAAAADPYARDVTRAQANVVRVGYGSGEQVADGHFEAAYAVPPPRRGHVKRSVALQPQERLAGILGGSSQVRVAEELVLRARADLDAGRTREAALQARIALEALAAELGEETAARLERHRGAVAAAANAALREELDPDLVTGLVDAVDQMRRELLRAAR